MIKNIKNSSGKFTGTIEITDTSIVIKNLSKPDLVIEDSRVLEALKTEEPKTEILILLYNEYTLTIGEIACLYNRCYSNMNKLLKTIPEITFDHSGRRNQVFGHPVSKEQSEKTPKALKGRKSVVYERTPEIREKISASLKKYYKEHPQDPTPHIKNWKEGRYDSVDFKRGISGHFTSTKMGTTIRFRSLLELYYLILIEEDPTIFKYIYEPFHLEMENGKTYMPDFLINDVLIVELKAKKYIERVEGVKEKVLYKQSQAIKYCEEHNLQYKIIYDEDIGFKSKKMKHYINNNPDIIKKYRITFTDPTRMVNK